MKAGWQTKTLGEVAEVFADGDWVESKDQSTEGVRLIQTGNVGEGVFKDRGDKARYISEATFKRLRCTEIFEGDCLISRLPDPVGRSCILPDTGERMITAVDCTIVRFDSKQIIPSFFNYYSQSTDYLDAVDAETSGTTRNRISRANLGKIAVPVPPRSEQQRIVGILDAAFDSIAKAQDYAKQNLQNARALFESHLQSVFTQRGEGWQEKSFEEVCHKITDGTHHSLQTQFAEPGPDRFPYITSKNIRNNYMDLSKVAYIERTFHEEVYARCQPSLGDVLLTKDGANTGNVTLNTLDEPFSLLSSVCLIKTDKKTLNPAFLCYYLQSSTGLSSIIGQMSGAAIKRIVLKDIKKAVISFPTIKEQDRIVTTLDILLTETQRLESLYQRKLAALDELKKSLLHQAFSGAL